MSEWIEKFKDAVKGASTRQLLFEYRGLFLSYVEYADVEDDIKLSIIGDEILRRAGELK